MHVFDEIHFNLKCIIARKALFASILHGCEHLRENG